MRHTTSLSIMLLIFAICAFLRSSAQTVKVKGSLTPADTLHFATLFELDEDRFKSLHKVSSDSIDVEHAITDRIHGILGTSLILSPLKNPCLNGIYLDSLVFRDKDQLLAMLKECNVDKVLVFGLIWRYKSNEYYRSEERLHRTFARGISSHVGLIGRTFLINAVILSITDNRILYEKKIKVQKESNGPPTKDNLRFFIPSFVRRALKPVKQLIKS